MRLSYIKAIGYDMHLDYVKYIACTYSEQHKCTNSCVIARYFEKHADI